MTYSDYIEAQNIRARRLEHDALAFPALLRSAPQLEHGPEQRHDALYASPRIGDVPPPVEQVKQVQQVVRYEPVQTMGQLTGSILDLVV